MKDNSEIKKIKIKKIAEKHAFDLGERVKELNCLYNIAELVEKPNISLKEILQGSANLIPSAMQYPEITCARIILGDLVLKTTKFRETIWKLSSDIKTFGIQCGVMDVYYLEEKPLMDEGPFLIEEKKLLNHAAERLGRIIERMQSENKLKESEELLSTILNAFPDAIFKVDTNLRIFWANKTALDMNPNSIGETCYKAYVDKEKPCEDCQCLRALETGQMETGIQYQPAVKGIKGESYWENIAVPLKDNQGKLIGLVEIARNVTERQQAEKALQRARDELEGKVAERTRELSEANLRLKELDRLKSMFIASMSHELRTPLNSIVGFTGVLLMGMSGKITKKQQDHLEIIKKNSHHLLTLINNIIDISKIEADKMIPILEEFNLSALLQKIKDSFSLIADKKSIIIYLKMTEKLNIRSDEHRIRQVLTNLVDNALKYTDKGKIEIKAIKKKGLVEISVKDTGLGIAEKDMDKLFKAFSQISVEGQLNLEGAGLGLYLTKKITNLLGGRIRVESEPGKGSEFVITLPCLTFDGDTS